MALNPVVFSHQVNERFRRYQLTAFPLTDRELARQVRAMLTSGPSICRGRCFRERHTDAHTRRGR